MAAAVSSDLSGLYSRHCSGCSRHSDRLPPLVPKLSAQLAAAGIEFLAGWRSSALSVYVERAKRK